jgi:hypothetical protein
MSDFQVPSQNSFTNNIIKKVTVHYDGVTYESSPRGTFLLDEKEDELLKLHREFTALQNVKPYSGLFDDSRR